MDHIITAAPQNDRIQYLYLKQENQSHLKQIDVFDGPTDTDAKIASAEYLYFEELANAHEDIGTAGDLVQIKTATLLDDKKSWKTQTVQYRYHRTDKKNDTLEGGNHQLKMVLETDAIARILDWNEGLKTPEFILEKGDNEILPGGLSLMYYASRAFSYYTEATHTNIPLQTVWAEENLTEQYGNPAISRPVPKGHVKTEMIRSGCATCGGSSASGGMKKTYYYLYVNTRPRSQTDENANMAISVVVEDTCDSEGKPVYRTIYSLNNRGTELRKIDIENPTSKILNIIATSAKRNSQGQITETRSSEVHANIRDNESVAKFLNPYDAKTKSWDNDLATMQKDVGKINVMEYDRSQPPRLTATKVKFGSEGNEYFVSATDYNDDGLVVAEYGYPERTIERNDKSCSGTIYRYTYWNGNEKVIKTKETIEAAIPLSQNGPGVPAATQEYYDQDGHLRWQRNASGVVTYYGYHPVSGERALTVRDVDTNNLPHIVTAQNKNVTSWTGPSPFQRNPKLEKAFNQIDLVEFDAQGKQIGNVDQDGIRDVTLELPGKIIRFSRWSMAEKRLLSPISVEEYNVADNVTSSYTLPFSAVVTENGLPAGVNSAAKKLTWTKYNYDPVQGNLLHVDRYHSIPANGVGELGTHYYRSVSIYDPMGRVAATADFVKEGEWVVNAQKYDWRGRSVETLRAVAMNPPQYIDLADEGWLETVSKTFYDGERNAKMLMMTGTGENDYRGTKYCYDKESQLRGTVSFYNDNGKEIAFGPFSVNDYDWQGNVTATAVFAQEPNWKAVATNAHYARETADSRQNLTLSYYNNNGMLYRSEQFAGAEQKTPVVRQDIYVDIEGRTVATERTGDTATEMAYNAIGASYQTRVIVKLSQNKYENGEFLYNSPVPRANLSEHQGGSSGVLRISHNEFNEQGRPIATHQMDSTDLAGIDFAKNNFVRQTAFWYDNKGNLVTQANYGSGDPEKGTGRWAYFPVLQRQTEPPQNLSEIVVVTKYYPELNVDNVDTNIDARGIVTKLFKDALGRSIRQVTNYVEGGKNDDENVTTSYEYNASGQVIAITDPLGNTSKREYDVHGRMVAEIDAEENKTQYLYDFEGKTIAVTDPLGRTTNFEYDKQGRQIKTILPAPAKDTDRPVEQIVYDALGRVSKNIDPLGNAKEFEYDNFGRIVTEIDAMGGLTKYTYDTAGRRTSLTDPVGNTTTFEYDILGRLVKETNSLEKSRFFEYVGTKPVKKTDRNGRVTEYIHDRFGRLKEKWLDGDKVVKSLKYENNWDGTLKIIGDENFRYDYKYDKFGRPESSIFKPGELAAIETTTRYDNLNRRKVLEMQSEKTEYTYSPRGQVASIKRGNQSVSYKYANQRVAAITPVMATAYSYDGLGRLSDIQHGKMANYGYKWDLASRISAMNIAGETATYSYDKASQLTGADYATLPDEKYDYDLNGNRKNFVTGKNNQLLSDGENEYKYDDEGNRIAKGNIRYEWDHRNRLTKVITPEEIVAYSYDHLNRLVSRNEEFFVHDGWQIVKVLDLQGETQESYFWGTKQDELLCENDAFVLTDHLGSVRKVVDKHGNAVSSLKYSAFGELVSCTGMRPRFRYTGKMFDDVTGLQWNVNRWYDANVGRWCSEDPIGFEALDTNLARYVGNDAIFLTDHNGLAPLDDYIDSGAKHCQAYHVTGIFSYHTSHVFLATEGQSFGFYQKSDLPIGPGQILENEFASAPENAPDADLPIGDQAYSICKHIWINKCYIPDVFRFYLIQKKGEDKADPPFYVIGLFDCGGWAKSTIGYALNNSRKALFDNKKEECFCENVFRDGDGFNYKLVP